MFIPPLKTGRMNSLEPFETCLRWKAEVLKIPWAVWGLEASVHTVVCWRGRFKGSPDLFLRVFHVPFEGVGVHSLVTIINIPLRMLTFPLRLLRKHVERQPAPTVCDPTELVPEPELAFGLSLVSPRFISSSDHCWALDGRSHNCNCFTCLRWCLRSNDCNKWP